MFADRTVDFDSKYKILRGETRAHRVPIHEKEQKGQNKNIHKTGWRSLVL